MEIENNKKQDTSGTEQQKQMLTNGFREVPEIREIKEGRDGQNVQESSGCRPSKAFAAWMITIVVLLTAAVGYLSFCLYNTTAKMQSVQASATGLQTKMKTTESKLNELSLAVLGDTVNAPEEDEEPSPEDMSEGEEFSNPNPTPPPEVYTVCLDAGHGDHDTGAVLQSEDGEIIRQEKDDNLWLTKLVQKELEAYGVKVLMTREDDSFLELYDRTEYANAMDADALISFHRNAYYLNGKMNDRVKGVEIWINYSRPTGSRQLANAMLDAILEVGGMEDRGVRYGSMTDYKEDYAINRRSLMTSMIVEMGFISNEADNEAYDANGEAYAKAMAKVIYEWLVAQNR